MVRGFRNAFEWKMVIAFAMFIPTSEIYIISFRAQLKPLCFSHELPAAFVRGLASHSYPGFILVFG